MDKPNSVCYGSVGAFEAARQPSRRKRFLSLILAAASILLCAALVFSGKSLFSGSSFTERLSELLPKHQLSPESEVSQTDARLGFIANWGNQTPTAKIYARHSPVLDGVVDFYLKFPVGSSKLRAPKWFMGIPVRGRGAAALKQVETAFLDGQIRRLPSPRVSSRSMRRKLLQKFSSSRKQSTSTSNKSPSLLKKTASPKKKVSSQAPVDSSTPKVVNCCLPDCAQGKVKGKFNGVFTNCLKCFGPDLNRCTGIMSFLKSGDSKNRFHECQKLFGAKTSIPNNSKVPQFFDPKTCRNVVPAPSPVLPPAPPPLPVPSCAMDQNSKFAGCSECKNIKEYPADDLCICEDILSNSKPIKGVTAVIRSDSLRCMKSTTRPPMTAAPPVTSPPSPVPTPRPPAKVCSHDVTKLNGNGKGCATCQGKRVTAATKDLPGNDYWACSQCRDKGICDFKCDLDKFSKVWQCRKGTSGPSPPPPVTQPVEPKCSADAKLNWPSASNVDMCQGFMCKKAGLLPSGEFGLVSYPKMNSYPKSLNPRHCCPFVAPGLSSASCHQKFGCEVPLIMEKGKSQWDLQDQVKSCKNFFCLQGVSNREEWSKKKGDSKFADGINKGRSACCAKLLDSVPDGKESWCPPPTPNPDCTGPDCQPIVSMNADECQSFLCQQQPMISNAGDSYALWLENQHKSGSRRLLQAAAVAPSPASPSAAKASWKQLGAAAVSASASASSKPEPLDPNVAQCIRTLKLSGIESWETNAHCVKEENEKIEEESEPEAEEAAHASHEGVEHSEGGEAGDNPGGDGPETEEHASEDSGINGPEIEPEEIEETECDAEEGPSAIPILPGADVLGYTYDPDFGMKGCNFDRCVMRPFIKYTYKDCKVVVTPAGQFKVPDQIYAYNLFQTSAKTHIYENEKEERASVSAEASISGSYGPGSASVSVSYGQSGDTKSKQHVAVRKIDVHLYRLTLLSTASFDHLHPAFVEAFKALPPRFEDSAHDYLQFVREWGRYIPSSGTFGGSLEIKMKFFSGSNSKKEDFSMGVEAAYDGGLFSVSASAKSGYSKEAKELENNNEISIDSSGGDPSVAALIADLKSPDAMSYREDVEKWLVSLPKYPRLVEDWPILQVLTKFIPSSPTPDGDFDPFTRRQGLLQALRILHDVDAKRFFDDRKCYPPFAPPSAPPSPASVPSAPDVDKSAGVTVIATKGKTPAYKDGAVQLFQHKDYQGKQLALPEGNYDCDELRSMNFDWVNSISSLKVKKGYWIYVYDKPGFQGASTWYDGAWSSLPRWNDRIQSLRVVSHDNYYKEKDGWQNGEMTCDAFGAKEARERAAAAAAAAAEAARKADIAKAKAAEQAQIELIASRKKKPLPSGKTSISFNDFDRMNVGQCLSFDAMTRGGIYVYMFSSPVSQSDAYSFHIGTKDVKFEKGFSGQVIKKTDDSNALAFGQNQLSQNVWFCVYPDAEDSSITVFSYGRGSYTLFEATQKDPVMINYFAIDCTQESTYRNIAVLTASRLLDSVKPFNRACKIVNCEKVQESESDSGTCACEKCDFGYQPYNNNQECVVADQCIAQFGCLSASPPLCTCEECCCGLSYDPISNNCVNANLFSGPGLGNAVLEPGLEKHRDNTKAVNKMSTKFKSGSSYRLKKLMFSCTETNVQNIRLSYDTSKPALGFIDYDSTHLIKQSDTAGKFDFSVYDNLRQSVAANPLYSASGFLNLDEVKLEEVNLASIAKKTGNALQEAFKFITEGAKEFAKNVEKVVKDVKEGAEKIVKDVKAKADEIAKIADTEFKKFVKFADKAYKDVVSVVQKVSQGAVDFVAQNAGLLKTLTGITGAVGGALVTALPQLMNAIPGCQAWCGILVSAVGNAAVGAATLAGNGLIDLAVDAKKKGVNPLGFLSKDIKDIPADIMKMAGPILDQASKHVNVNDILQFANSSGASDIMNAISKGGLNNMKDVFKDPGLSNIADKLLTQGTSMLGNVLGGDGGKSLGNLGDIAGNLFGGDVGKGLGSVASSLFGGDVGKGLGSVASVASSLLGGDVGKGLGSVASTGLGVVSPLLDKVVPGAGGILETASKHILPGITGLLGGLFKKRSLLSLNEDHSSEVTGEIPPRFPDLFFDLGKLSQDLANHAKNGFKFVSDHVGKAGDAIKSAVTKSVDAMGGIGKNIAGGLDAALGTNVFSKAHNDVHNWAGGGIKNFVNGVVDGGSGFIQGALNHVNDRIQSVFDPNRAKREYMNSQEYKEKMAAKAIFETFSKKLDLPSNMPKHLTDSIVQWIMGEMKVTPLGKQPFVTNLIADNQCVSETAPNTCTEEDIKCIVLANKCFLDDEECVRAALKKVPTAALEKYAATHRLNFPGSSYGRYIRISAPKCKKRAVTMSGGSRRSLLQSEKVTADSEESGSEPGSEESGIVQDEHIEMPDAEVLFSKQAKLNFGLISKFWKQPTFLISRDANGLNRMDSGRRLSRGMSIKSPNGGCKAEVQNDGNFVISYKDSTPVWSTKTSDISVLYLWPDGNLCAYKADGSWAWGCHMSGQNTFLFLHDDCNLVLYKDSGKNVAWKSNSFHVLGQMSSLLTNGLSHLANLAMNTPDNKGDRSILSDLPGTLFKSAKPEFQGQVSNIDFASSNNAFAGSPFKNDFLAQFSGNIFVPISGSWTFHLTSDDGSRLYIDGNQVIDNDGFHGMVEVSGSVVLSRGMHSIDVSFFQGGFGAGLTLAWSGPSVKKGIIPKEFFLLNSKDVPLSMPREFGCNLDNTLQISQIAVFDPFGTNVALNKPCDSTSLFATDKLVPYLPADPENVYPSMQTCSRAVDGNLVNRNGNEIFQSTDPDSDTVTFDLGQDVFIKRVMYWNRKDCCQSMIAGATLEIITENGDVVNSEVLNEKLVQSFDFPAFQSRATLFTECNYGGEQVAIGPGNYKFALLQIPRSSLSSIKLPNDLEIKLFQGENFDGQSTPWITADVPCLTSFQFNDRTGSVQIRERSKLQALNSNEVVFYDNCDFKGNSMSLIPGTYSASQMSLTRNSIMSVMVPPQLEVEFYSFDHQGGRSSGWLQKSFSCLTDIDFSRTTVSLIIRSRSKPTNRKLLSESEQNRNKLIAIVLPHAAQHAFYMPKNGDSQSAQKVLRLAVHMAHYGAHAIAESHAHHREMVASIAKWVPHQYVLSALKMDLEQGSATSAFTQTAISRVHQSLFTQLTDIIDTTAQNSLNVLDQTVVNILGEAYAPVTLPGPCFSHDLIMSYLPTNLRVGIDTWVEMDKFSWIQEIRVDSVDSLLKDPKVVQSEQYFMKGMSFKISQYKSVDDQTNERYFLVRGIQVTYQKSPSFGGPGDIINTFIGKSQPDTSDPVPITDCNSIEFGEGEFLVGMSVVVIPEGLAGINSVLTNKREIQVKCGQKPSIATEMTSDDGVVWMYCDAGYDAVGIGGKFDSRVMRTLELHCSPTSQADRVQFLGVYSYSFQTDEFFNGIGSQSPGYTSKWWGSAPSIGITSKQSKDNAAGWDLRIWTNRVPPISPVTGVAPLDVVSSARSESEDKAARESYKKVSDSSDFVAALAPPNDKRWYFDVARAHYTDINRLSFVENTQEGVIKGVYVDYSARSDLYSGYMLNSEVSYKNLRIKTLKLERNEYWTGLKVGLDPVTGAVSCIVGVKTSVKEYGILCGSRDSICLKKAGWIECPSNTPMMVALQEDFNSNNVLIGMTPICVSLKATRFVVDEFTVMFEEDEFMNQMTVRRGWWLDAVLGVSTNKRNIPLQCGLLNGGFETNVLSLPGQFLENKVKKSKAVVGLQVDVVVDDSFGVFADTEPIEALSSMQKSMTPAAAQAIMISKNEMRRDRGPGPTIIDIKLMSTTFDADPLSAVILESPEEAGRSRIPEFYDTGVYHQLTFDMVFDFYKPRLAQFQQMSSFEFQCQRGRSTSKDFWMPWFQFSFTSGDKYPQGDKSTNQLAVSKKLTLSAEEYIIRIELSSHKDKGYAITAIKTNVKYYSFRCGAMTIALDVPPGGKHLVIGLAGNLKSAADGTYFTNLQALHLKLNAFAGEPSEMQLNQ